MPNPFKKATILIVVAASIVTLSPNFEVNKPAVASPPTQSVSSSEKKTYSIPLAGTLKIVNNATVLDATIVNHAKLVTIAGDAYKRTSATVAGKVTNKKLVELKTAVDDTTTASAELFTYEFEAVHKLEPLTANVAERTEVIEAETVKRTKAVTDAVVAWETELAAEKKRIAAEVARKKAEAAAKAAAEATRGRSSSGGSNNSYSSPSNGGGGNESGHQKISRIMSSMGISVPFIISGNCGAYSSVAYACYAFDGQIRVAPVALGRPECRIRYYIAHEYRHYQQHMNGQVDINSSGGINNRAWLESDAEAFGYRYGC